MKGQRYYDYMLLIILLRILVDRCGEDLKILFSNPDIQHFLNSIPMCDLKSDKAIYQPGTLRKVSAPCINSASVCMHSNSLRHALKNSSIRFSALQLKLPDAPGTAIGELAAHQPPFTVYWDHIDLDDFILEFRGVVGQNGSLVHVGDFVMLSSVHTEQVTAKTFVVNHFTSCIKF